jgi:hypothetical protein
MKYIVWMLDGYSREIIRKILSGEIKDAAEWDKFDGFIGDLKKLFYKQQELPLEAPDVSSPVRAEKTRDTEAISTWLL